MIDHISVRVQDFPRLLSFYRAALAPIGYQVVMEFPDAAGLGEKGKPDLWLMKTDRPLNPTHLAISAARDSIEAFHAAALAAGGTDNGSPGLRLDYHPNYYAAYVLDPEGNNIEVVSHAPPRAQASAKKAPPKKRRTSPKAKKKKPQKKTAKKSAKRR